MFIKSVKPHVFGWLGCESRMCSAVLVGSAAGNSCQKFQNQNVISTRSSGCSGRAELENTLRFLGVFSNFSSAQEKFSLGLPVGLLSTMFLHGSTKEHQGDAVEVPPATGRACFQGKKNPGKKPNWKIRIIFMKALPFTSSGGKSAVF